MRKQRIEGAIQPIVVDLLRRYAHKVIKRGLRVPRLGDLKVRRGGAKPGKGEHGGHDGPRNVLSAGRDMFLAERGQTKTIPQQKPKIHIAEMAHPLNAYPLEIHCGP